MDGKEPLSRGGGSGGGVAPLRGPAQPEAYLPALRSMHNAGSAIFTPFIFVGIQQRTATSIARLHTQFHLTMNRCGRRTSRRSLFSAA